MAHLNKQFNLRLPDELKEQLCMSAEKYNRSVTADIVARLRQTFKTETSTNMARTDPQFNLRIPQELKEQIEKSAKDDGRSVNAQAVHLLKIGLQQSAQQDERIVSMLADILVQIQAIKNQ